MGTRRNLLVVTAGKSPGVITEAIYQLIVVERVRLDEVHVWTTSEAEGVLKSTLLTRDRAAFHRLCCEYRILHPPLFEEQSFHVPTLRGEPLRDLRTEQDNKLFCNELFHWLKAQRNERDVRIFGCFAGGRKSMSTALGQIMQLLGRSDDRLFHVLVSPAELERVHEFYYPTSLQILDRQGQTIDATPGNVSIDLAEQPFVRLHGHLSGPLRARPNATFDEAVSLMQRELQRMTRPPRIRVYPRTCRIALVDDVEPDQAGHGIESIEIDATPLQRVLLVMLALRRLRCARRQDTEECPGCENCWYMKADIDEGWFTEDFVKLIESRNADIIDPRLRGKEDDDDSTPSTVSLLSDDPDVQLKGFRDVASRLREAIVSATGDAQWLSSEYYPRVESVRVNRKQRMLSVVGLPLSPSRIEVAGP